MMDLVLVVQHQRIPLPTAAAQRATMRVGPRGLERIVATLPASTLQAMTLIDQLGNTPMRLELWSGGARIAAARVEDVAFRAGQLTLTALGGWRVLQDAPYTALWSTRDYRRFNPTTPSLSPAFFWNRRPERFRIEVSNRLVMSLEKGTSYPNGDACGLYLRNLSRGSRPIIGVQCAIRSALPAGWAVRLHSFSDDMFSSFTGAPIAYSHVTSGLLTRAFHVVFSVSGAIEFACFNDSGGTSTPSGETGTWYMLVESLRVVTSATNRVSTALTAPLSAGTNVTMTVASTARMEAGLELVINSGGGSSEVVTVASVTSSTQAILASVASSHVIGETVQGFVVYADELARDVVLSAPLLPGEILRPDGIIASCPRDVQEASYEDASRTDVLADLAEQGDGQRRYQVGVNARGLVVFTPDDTTVELGPAPHWLVEASDLEVQQSLQAFVNAVYARYKDNVGRAVRTTPQSRSGFARPGTLVRTGWVTVDTTIQAGAEARALVAAQDTDQPATSYRLTIQSISPLSGGPPVPVTVVEPGHRMTVRAIGPGRGGQRGVTLTFTVGSVEHDLVAGTITVEPDHPLPTPEYVQAAIQRAAEAAASSGQTPGGASPQTTLPEQARTATLAAPERERTRA